jgi:hypothetical protein
MKEKTSLITVDAVKKACLFVDLNVKHHEKSCHTCRYFRANANGSYCLYMGSMMSQSGRMAEVVEWAMTVVCDAWKKRPSTWNIYSRDPLNNDHHIPKKTQKRFRA